VSKLKSQMRRLAAVRLLAVDDNPEDLKLIVAALSQEGLEILTAEDAEPGFEVFLQSHPGIVLLSPAMSGAGGMDLLERMLRADPGANVILISGHYSADSAVEALKRGACDYLTKPIDIQRLQDRIADLLAEANIRKKTLRLAQKMLEACQFEGIVSHSPLMHDVFAMIRRAAPHFRTVLITGATGTGKELVARALHTLSPALADRFVVCNCSALVESLVESELFGYVKGAFTGASQDKTGLIESADGGVIFLDEIGELSPGAQAKLLRVLQDHRVQRVGSTVSHKVDLRIIAATNRDLRTMVREGKFREDLYYRLAVVEIGSWSSGPKVTWGGCPLSPASTSAMPSSKLSRSSSKVSPVANTPGYSSTVAQKASSSNRTFTCSCCESGIALMIGIGSTISVVEARLAA